jgi:hypothetical protein
MPRSFFDPPECPGPDCPMCNGECCDLCGAGCWDNTIRDPKDYCTHDVIERHNYRSALVKISQWAESSDTTPAR